MISIVNVGSPTDFVEKDGDGVEDMETLKNMTKGENKAAFSSVCGDQVLEVDS